MKDKYIAVFDPGEIFSVISAKPCSLSKATGLCINHFWKYLYYHQWYKDLKMTDIYCTFQNCSNEANFVIIFKKKEDNEKLAIYLVTPTPIKNLGEREFKESIKTV